MLCQINCNLSHLVVTPGHRQVGYDNERICHQRPAESFKNPRTLYHLWVEWEFAIKGNKAAKFFTAKERGEKNKNKFYLRKFFWTTVSEMVRNGRSAQAACDKIYDVHGHNTVVSRFLKQLQRDKKWVAPWVWQSI